MDSDRDIQYEFQENYQYAHDFWEPFVRASQIATLGASGYTWSDNELEELRKEGREPLEFNIMRRPLQFFSGYLRDNLHSVVVSPMEGSDQQTADQLTKLQYYIWNKGYGYSTFLDAADEMFKAGISLCGIQMDYSKDFINGDITFFKRTFNSFFLDPTFEKIDLSDCSFAITRDLISKEGAKQLLPFIDPSIIDDIHSTFRDNKFRTFNPFFTTTSRHRSLLSYDQYYKRITRKRTFLIDERASFYKDITDLSEEEKKMIKKGMKRIERLHEEADLMGASQDQLPPLLQMKTVDRPYVELHIMLNGQRVYCGEDKTGVVETYPFAPLICYFEPSLWQPSQRLQGIPATMWSLQRQFNKRHMKIIDMMDSDISKGFKYLIGSVPDPKDLQQSGQNKMIGVDPENAPEGLGSVQELQGGGANPSLIEYQGILDNLAFTLSNVNESVLGVDEKGNTQISGRLAQVRIGQGLRSNRKVFDNIETSQQVLGKIILKCIQATMPPGKVERIIEEQPTQQFYEKEFEQYDAIIKEGVRSQSQKDAYYYELVNLKREGIIDVPQSAIIKALQMAGMSELEKEIEQQDQQQAQAQKMQTDLALKLTESEVNEKNALAKERNTRSDANEGLTEERASESVQNRAQAVLDRAKTITEIAKMEDERIMKVMDFVNQLVAEGVAEREIVDQNIQSESDEEDPEQKKKKEAAMQELEQIASNQGNEQPMQDGQI